MEKAIRDLYSDEIRCQIFAVYGIHPEDAQTLDGFESFIYAFQRGSQQGILRVSHTLHRSPNQVLGELDWIRYLHQGGAAVSCPIPTREGDLVAVVPDGVGGSFVTAAFERAPGVPHKARTWPANLLREYGFQLGRMHQLARSYRVADPAWKRPEWDDPLHLDIVNFIPEGDQGIKDRFWENVAQIRALPKDRGSYGLIHQDPHAGNFFLNDEGGITFFDFDDCSYSWFVEDIALAIFYAALGQEDPADFTDRFLGEFLPGYFAAYPLDPKWFQAIPLFQKRREIDLYAVIHRSFDVQQLDDPWPIWYLEGRKESIINRRPVLEFDFEGFDYQRCR